MLLIALLSIAPVLPAQAVQGYARPAGDTVRYRRQATVSAIVDSPRGPMEQSTVVDESVAFTFGGADSAVAWYDALDVARSALSGRVHPDAAGAIGRPFVLRLDGRGRVQVLAEPPLSDSILQLADPRGELIDFFLRLPDRPLAVGMEWTDTLVVRGGSTWRRTSARSIAHHKVERDTTVGGVAAVIVTVAADDSVEVHTMARHGESATTIVVRGPGTNTYVFAPSTGVLLSRDYSGEQMGTEAVFSGANVKRYPETLHYQGSIRRIVAP